MIYNVSDKYRGAWSLGYTKAHITKVHSTTIVAKIITSKLETDKNVVPMYRSTSGAK